MMEKLFKYLPIVIGILLGWLLTNPPAFLAPLGPARHLVTGALVLLLLLVFVGFQILASLPENVALESAPGAALEAEMRSFSSRYEALGFAMAGPPWRVGTKPPALLLGFVHEGERTYGTVFRTGTAPPKTSFDFVSIFDGGRGGLTSNAERMGAAIPASPGSLRQVFPGAGVEEVFARHRDAIAYLRGRGISCRPVSAADLPADLRQSLRRQRRAFVASPIRGAIVTLWRAATGSTPHVGPIQTQSIAESQIRELQTGRRA